MCRVNGGKDAPTLAAPRGSKLAAALWLERLEPLEDRLAEKNIRDLANYFASDGVTGEKLRKSKDASLERIASARKHLQERLRLSEAFRECYPLTLFCPEASLGRTHTVLDILGSAFGFVPLHD
jgi:hypothetical protein